ncbi:hypothetical protein EDD15DRAFT_2203755 [Pisolithus albus]|nr:hypothetical protein EDD15DRAFT_2203755 [Pisolithus albus]
MSTFFNPPFGNTQSIDEEFKKKWKQALDEIDFHAASAPVESSPDEDLKRWLQGWKLSLVTKTLQANLNRLSDEGSQLKLGPGDQANIDQCKRLQCKFEGVIEGRESKGKSKANGNILVGQSVENPSGPAQDSGTPEVIGSSKAKGNIIPQDTEMIMDRCERCISKRLSCAGVKGKACPRYVDEMKNCSYSDQTRGKTKNIASTEQARKRRRSLPSEGASISLSGHKRRKYTPATNHSTQLQSSQESHSFQNNPRHSPQASTPDSEQISQVTTSAAHSVCLAQAEARVQQANVEMIKIQHATINTVMFLAEVGLMLRQLQNKGTGALNDSDAT